MNLNRLINMVVNVVMRRLINTGINKGIGWWSRRGQKPAAPVTSTEALHRHEARETAKRARQAAKVTRRLGR
ncbi:MAG: hypothetical protein R3E44_13920 [Paracoccaceae bacterium]